MHQNEIEMCFHMLGDNSTHNLYIQFSEGMEEVRFTGLGLDEDGVYLLSEDDLKSRLSDEAAVLCYEESAGSGALFVTVLDDDGNRCEYPIERLDSELADDMAYGA